MGNFYTTPEMSIKCSCRPLAPSGASMQTSFSSRLPKLLEELNETLAA